jgi:uncharacterized protein (DUF2147 family)
MTRIATLGVVLVLGAVALAAAGDGDAILGLWQTQPSTAGHAQVEITKVGSTYGGRIVWLEIPLYPPDDEQGMGGKARVDRNNSDPARHTAPIIGLEIVHDFVFAGDNQWKDGFIYDPDNGKTYRCKARLEGNVLKLRGFIGISLLGRTTEWVRVERPAAAPPPSTPR